MIPIRCGSSIYRATRARSPSAQLFTAPCHLLDLKPPPDAQGRLLRRGHNHQGYHSIYSHMQHSCCRICTILEAYKRTLSFSILRIRPPIAINNRLLLRSPLKGRTLILLRLASYYSRTLYRIRPPGTRHRPRLTTTRTTVCTILDSMRRKLR